MKVKGLDTACSVCTSGISVVCMSSMGAALAGAIGAGAAGMTGMGGGSRVTLLLPRLMEAIGLGFLNHLPDAVLRPTLVAFLVLTAGAAFIGYVGHRRLAPLVLTLISAALMYPSIYVWMSEPLYFLSLLGVLGGGVWGILVTRRPQNV